MTRLVPVLLFIVAAAAAMAIAPPLWGDAGPSTAHGFVTMPDGTQMVRIPGGWFLMGSGRGEPDERPVHRVWISAFLMDRTEVTQEAYGRFVLANPSHFKGPRLPAEQVSWAAAALYCNARSKAEGLKPCYDEETALCDFSANGYRLPTEAEWEYACRAGTDTEYPFGKIGWNLSAHAWFEGNAEGMTHPVGQRRPNRWGLFDMLGNVAEWCNDIYGEGYYAESPERNPVGPTDGERYVVRGGAWNSPPEQCRPACRLTAGPGFQDACFRRDDIGFRCVRAIPSP